MYQPGFLSGKATRNFRLRLELDQDAYDPGQPIHITVHVTSVDQSIPAPSVRVTANLIWRKALPGTPEIVPSGLSHSDIKIDTLHLDTYTTILIAPGREGYYLVRSEVYPGVKQKPIMLEELILVEQKRGPDSLTLVQSGQAGDLPSR